MIIKKQHSKKSLTGVSIKIENPRNVYDLYSNEFSGLSPMLIKEYFEAKRKGANFFAGLLFDESSKRDLRIGSLLQTRKLAVANKEWLLEFPEDSTLSESEQKEVIKFLEMVYKQIKIESYISQTNNAQLKGVQLAEIMFKTDGTYMNIDRIDAIPHYMYLYDDTLNEYKFLDYQKADVLALRTAGNVSSTLDRIDVNEFALPDEVEPEKILEVHSLDGDSMNGFLNGVDISLQWGYLFKNYGLKDWAIYIERFAIPAVIGKYPALMNEQDRAVLEKAVRDFGHLFNALIPKEAEMTFSGDGNKSGSTDLFKNYQDFWNTEMSLRVLGQAGTTNKLDKGSYAAIDALEGVRHDITLGDLIVSARAVNDLNDRIMLVNPGKFKEMPVFKFKELINMEAKLKQSQMMVNLYNAGVEIDENDLKALQREFGFAFVKKLIETAPGSATGFTGQFSADTWLTKWIYENK